MNADLASLHAAAEANIERIEDCKTRLRLIRQHIAFGIVAGVFATPNPDETDYAYQLLRIEH